jgi:hypothetical protein
MINAAEEDRITGEAAGATSPAWRGQLQRGLAPPVIPPSITSSAPVM